MIVEAQMTDKDRERNFGDLQRSECKNNCENGGGEGRGWVLHPSLFSAVTPKNNELFHKILE